MKDRITWAIYCDFGRSFNHTIVGNNDDFLSWILRDELFKGFLNTDGGFIV
jgi:hypothetical protein